MQYLDWVIRVGCLSQHLLCICTQRFVVIAEDLGEEEAQGLSMFFDGCLKLKHARTYPLLAILSLFVQPHCCMYNIQDC